MSWRLERLLSLVGIGLVLSTTGCVVPKSRLTACQAYNCELQRRNQQVCAQYETLRRQNQELAGRTLDSDDLLSNYQKRMSEFQGERDQMQNSYASLLDQGRSNPLPREVRKKLEYFASRHPEDRKSVV